jgi:hypothetical protein
VRPVAPRVPPSVRRPRATHTSTTPACRAPIPEGFWPRPEVLASASDPTARPGSCRKPPGGLYAGSGKEGPASRGSTHGPSPAWPGASRMTSGRGSTRSEPLWWSTSAGRPAALTVDRDRPARTAPRPSRSGS